jgi:predicted LPLAT superfamily acyltransferase
MSEKNWSGKTQGGNFGQKSIYYYFRYGSLRAIYGLLFFIIPFYMIFSRKGYRVSAWYAQNCFQYKSWKIPFFVFRNFYAFGTVFLDRFALFGNPKRKFRFTIENNHEFLELISQPEGFLIAGAHLGNYEILSYSLKQSEKKIYPILYGDEAKVFQQQRSRFFEQNNLEPIILTNDGSHIFEINNALKKGEIVSMPADRTMENMKTITVDFLGKTAPFPAGIFHLSATYNIPVLTIFAVKESYRHYKIFIQKLMPPVSGTKEEKALCLCSEFVKSLEKTVLQYPEQWYNFYPFWEEQKVVQ